METGRRGIRSQHPAILRWLRVAVGQPVLLAAVLVLAWVGHAAEAGTFVLAGPETYQRGAGAPTLATLTFAVRDPGSSYVLVIDNGAGGGPSERVTSAILTLNGRVVVGPNRFSKNVTTIRADLAVQATNTLTIELRGDPGTKFSVAILGVDDTPPTLRLSAGSDPPTLLVE